MYEYVPIKPNKCEQQYFLLGYVVATAFIRDCINGFLCNNALKVLFILILKTLHEV